MADCYDAMTSSRSYSKPRAQEKVRSEFERCKGTQFDPVIADQMIALIDADKEYSMNENGYHDSAIARYTKELMKRTHRVERHETAEAKVSNGVEEEELPDWLRNNENLDSQAGLRNCGSVEGYLSILMNFYASIEEKASEIEKYCKEGNIEDYTIKVHALKSSARIIGAVDLSEKARSLEEAGDADNKEKIDRDTPALLKLYRAYQEWLSPIRSGGLELPEADDATVQDAYNALTEFADAMDYALARMVLDSMDEYRLKPEDRSRFDQLRSAVAQMDWDQVHNILIKR